jgi:hypothetical protein
VSAMKMSEALKLRILGALADTALSRDPDGVHIRFNRITINFQTKVLYYMLDEIEVFCLSLEVPGNLDPNSRIDITGLDAKVKLTIDEN